MNYSNIDIEELLGYNSKKFTEVQVQNTFYNEKIEELSSEKNKLYENLYTKSDSSFYWVLWKHKPKEKLFKFFGDLSYLENLRKANPVERAVQYSYLKIGTETHQAVHVYGFDYVSAIINRYKSEKKITIKKKELIELTSGLYLYREPFDPAACTIFFSVLDFQNYISSSEINLPKVGKEILNFQKHVNFLEKELKIKIDKDRIQEEDLYSITSACYDYTKRDDIFKLYPSLCSIVLKYMLDGKFGELDVEKERIYIRSKDEVFYICDIVLKNIGYLVSYEYNPNLYFLSLPSVYE